MDTETQNNLVFTLKQQNKHILANRVEKYAQENIDSYSRDIWKYEPKKELESALIEAFKKEFTRLDIDEEIQEKIISSLSKKRSIQTAPHTGLHDSSRMMLIHHISTLGLSNQEYYVVGTFSGIPFSNDSYPGAFSFSKQHSFSDIFINNDALIVDSNKKQKDRERDIPQDNYNRINFIKPKDKDGIVYRSKVPETYKEIYKSFSQKIKENIEDPTNEDSFTKVMLTTNQKLISNAIQKEKIIFIDINEVISNYLEIVLKDENHFIYKIFFDKTLHSKMIDIFTTDEHFFYYTDNTNKTQQHAYIENFLLKTKNKETDITPEKLISLLKNTELCPGIFIGFTVLSFLNDFQCFGSFKQVEYLSRYKKIWQESNLLPNDISHVPSDTLTTGELPDENLRFITPIDIALGSSWKVDDKYTFGDLIKPMIPLLQAFKN